MKNLETIRAAWDSANGVNPQAEYEKLCARREDIDRQIAGTPKNCTTKLTYLDQQWAATDRDMQQLKRIHPHIQMPMTTFDTHKYFFQAAKAFLSRNVFETIMGKARTLRSQAINKDKKFYKASPKPEEKNNI